MNGLTSVVFKDNLVYRDSTICGITQQGFFN